MKHIKLIYLSLLFVFSLPAISQEVIQIESRQLDGTTLDQLHKFWYRQPIETIYEQAVSIKADFPQEVEMRSEQSITLKPGFTVEKGASFHGYIDEVEFSAELDIDIGEDKIYCFRDKDVVEIQIGGLHTIKEKHPEVTYTIEWFPTDFMDDPTIENPTLTLRKSDRESGLLEANRLIMLKVTDNLGNVGIDVISIADCDEIDPYTGLTFTNHGTNISIQKGTFFSVYGNVFNDNGGIPGIESKEGKWINEGTIEISQSWGNDATSTGFVEEFADPQETGTPEVTGLVEFIGKDQTIYGQNTTVFNDLYMTKPGVKHLRAETNSTIVKGILQLNESEINCHTTELLLDNDAIDALVKAPSGKIITYNTDDSQGWFTRKVKDINPEFLVFSDEEYIFPLAGYKYKGDKDELRYRPVVIGSHTDGVYFKSSYVFENPLEKTETLGPNIEKITNDYHYEFSVLNEEGEEADGIMDITICTDPTKDGRLTALAHMDDEPAYRSEEVPVWKYTGKIFYVPASTPEQDYATFEDFYECGIKNWSDFSTKNFSLIEAGLALFTDNLELQSYLKNYPSESEVDQARIDPNSPRGNVFAPKVLPIDPSKPFSIEMDGGENSTNATLSFYVDEHLQPKKIMLDPNGDGTEYELSPDLVITNDGELALFDISNKPISSESNCSDIIQIELKDGILLTPNMSTYERFRVGGLNSLYTLNLKVYDKTQTIQLNSGSETGSWTSNKWECSWLPDSEGTYNFILEVVEPESEELSRFMGQFVVYL